jgi:hypothetical protein
MDQNKQSGKELLSTLKDALNIQGDFRDILKDSIKELDKTLSSYDKILAKVGTINKSAINTKDINASIKKTVESQFTNKQKLADLETKLSDDQKRGSGQLSSAVEKLGRLEGLRMKAAQSGNLALEARALKQIQNQQAIIDEKTKQLGLDALAYAEAVKKEQLDKESLKILNEQLAVEKKVAKTVGAAGAMAKMFGQNLGVGTETYEKMVKKARELEGTNKWFKSTRVLFTGIKSAIKESWEDPLLRIAMLTKANSMMMSGLKSAFGFIGNIAKKVLDIITGWNGKIFEFGKNLGVGERDSRRLMGHFKNISDNSGPLLIRTSKIAETFTSMTESLGFMAPMNSEMLTTATLLQRQFGLTAEHINAINQLQALGGKSFKDTANTIIGVNNAEGGRLKFSMNIKQVLGEISKVSSLVLLNFKGNVPALTAAVVQSKKLGMSLNEVAATANGFLDFESSISKEFEAQLLTGKDLNLQTLRRLALNHDTKGMMDEIGKRIPSMLAFEKMNTIERQSYAEALNMTEESMAEIIKKQEINNRLGTQGAADATAAYEILKKRGLTHSEIIEKMRAEGAETYATQNITERWSALIERIQDQLGQMAEGPLGKIINQFIDIISQTGFFEGVMKKVKVVIDSIAGFFADLPTRIQQMLRMAQTVFSTIAAFQAAAAITLAFTPGGQAAAVGMGIGAAKMMAASYGAGVAADTVGDMALKGKKLFNQGGGNSTGNQSNNNQNQNQPPINLTVVQKIDGQHMSVAAISNVQEAAPIDNTGHKVYQPKNFGVTGQTPH